MSNGLVQRLLILNKSPPISFESTDWTRASLLHEKGIVIQRVMMVDMERFFSKWGPPFGSHPERYRLFHEQEGLARLYRTAAGAATEFYHTYWEEPFPDFDS